ncbi:MAG: caspase family protein [Bacteroidales bacterium]|nr:caspase family protein [Bacteroidales bacterium]
MKKLFILASFICLCLEMTAQTMHTLIFINEQEKGRETDRQADMRKMKSFITDVAKRIGYTNDMRTHSGAEFTSEMVYSEINRLKVNYNDIVMFYYHGHGANASNNTYESKWPSMALADKSLEQSEVQKELERQCKQAKLVLCIADCCNRYYYRQNPPSEMDTRTGDNIKKLFTNFNGQKFIVISASKPGQYGYSANTGSVFGDNLRNSINYYASSSTNPTWESVLSKAQADTKKHNAQSGHISEPQYDIYNRAQVSPTIIPADVKGDLY